VALFLGDQASEDFQAFDAVTKVVDEAYFAHSNEQVLRERFGQQGSAKLIVLKHHDEL